MANPTITAPHPKKSLVLVGDGRGFVVEEPAGFRRRFVITAAHCLPNIPAAAGQRPGWGETFKNLLGPPGGELSVWTECFFADPIADVAVLGPPENQSIVGQSKFS